MLLQKGKEKEICLNEKERKKKPKEKGKLKTSLVLMVVNTEVDNIARN